MASKNTPIWSPAVSIIGGLALQGFEPNPQLYVALLGPRKPGGWEHRAWDGLDFVATGIVYDTIDEAKAVAVVLARMESRDE